MSLNTDPKRIFGLDIVRSIAILLVVFVHGGFILDDTVLEGFPYFRMIDGVTIFFVLSGFLIGRILLKEIENQDGFGPRELTKFWKRRWFRTLPAYYLILALNYIFVKHKIIQEDIEQFNFHFLTFTQNFKTPFKHFFWESWSLSVEEWFYIMAPLLILFLMKVMKPKYSFLITTLIMIIAPICYRYSIYDDRISSAVYSLIFKKTVLCRLDSIGYGLVLAWIYHYYNTLWERIKIPFFIFGVILIIAILNYKQSVTTIYRQVMYFSLTPLSIMFVLPLTESYKKSKGVLAIVIQHISKISYSMYLINLALVAEVIRDNFSPEGGMDGIIKYLIYWCVVIIVSSALYKYFEKPMMDLRDKKFFSF